ncbi:MAG: hypothetical protein R3A48_05655 [Polyangiales bacterium]
MASPTRSRAPTAASTARWRPSPEALIALAFALVAALVGRTGRLPDDEGYLTFIGASITAKEPLAGLFFQKVHPAISALYAPAARLGWGAFLLAHAATGGLGLYLLGRVARRVSSGPAWLPPLIVATSPLYFLSAATGQSNSAALLFLAGAIALSLRGPDAQLAAGVVTAAGLWTRYEFAPYFFALVAVDVLHLRRARLAAGFSLAALAYILAGACYHRDPRWIFTHPPVLLHGLAAPSTLRLAHGREGMASLLSGLFLVSPVALLPLAIETRRMPPLGRRAAQLLAALLVLQLSLPQLGLLFNFDYNPRYFLCHLPLIALLASEFTAHAAPDWRRAAALAAAGAAITPLLPPGFRALTAGLLFVLPLLTLFWLARASSTAGAALLGTLLAPLTLGGSVSSLPLPGLSRAVSFVSATPADVPVYTNVHQLQSLLDARRDGRRVRYLAGVDMIHELAGVLGERPNRQSDAVFRALTPMFYGRALWPCELPHRAPAGSLLVLGLRDRAARVYDLRAWTRASTLVLSSELVTVWRAPRPVDVPGLPPPAEMSASTFRLPCAASRSSLVPRQ